MAVTWVALRVLWACSMGVVKYIAIRLFAWALLLAVMLIVSMRVVVVLREQEQQEKEFSCDFNRERD